jgi:hypothetical protein
VRGSGGAIDATGNCGRAGAAGGALGIGSGRDGGFTAGAADLAAFPSRPGTMKSRLHFWHRTCLPANSSGNRNSERQPRQNVEIAIADSLLGTGRPQFGPIGRERTVRYPLQFTRPTMLLAMQKDEPPVQKARAMRLDRPASSRDNAAVSQ